MTSSYWEIAIDDRVSDGTLPSLLIRRDSLSPEKVAPCYMPYRVELVYFKDTSLIGEVLVIPCKRKPKKYKTTRQSVLATRFVRSRNTPWDLLGTGLDKAVITNIFLVCYFEPGGILPQNCGD